MTVTFEKDRLLRQRKLKVRLECDLRVLAALSTRVTSLELYDPTDGLLKPAGEFCRGMFEALLPEDVML